MEDKVGLSFVFLMLLGFFFMNEAILIMFCYLLVEKDFKEEFCSLYVYGFGGSISGVVRLCYDSYYLGLGVRLVC